MGFFSFGQLLELWSFWEVRSIVLFSLFLQTFLILVSPLRTKTANSIISVLLWLAYLLADAAAIFAVGLISHSHVDVSADKQSGELLAFWAPILIIHLGGPDTITALALEDNELWKRHLLQLLSQLAATVYVLYKSMSDSELLAPKLLVLFAGLIKYGERVYSLYLASVDKFRDSVNNPKIVFWLWEPIEQIEVGDADISHIEMVQHAYTWFTMFKGLVADSIYNQFEWKKTREYFSKRNAEQAFRVVGIELNFIYDALYTKTPVIRTWVGYIFRLACFVLVLVSFFLWHSIDKSHIPPHDVKITYALLGGAITLDVIAFFMFIFSDRSIVWVIKGTSGPEDASQQNKKSTCRYQLKRLINRYLAISDRRWSGYSKSNRTALSKLLSQIFCFWRSSAAEAKAEGEERTIPLPVIASRIFCRRWSESVQQFNLIDYCVNVRSGPVEKVSGWVGLTGFLDRVQYVSIRWFSESLRDSIFSELKAKSETMGSPEDAHKICEARGEWVLENELSNFFSGRREGWKILKPWLTDIPYDASLILWHIATEVCYNYDVDKEEEDDDACQRKHPGSRHKESEIGQQRCPETDQEEEDSEQQKGTKTDLEEEDDAEKQIVLRSLEKEDDVEQQLRSSESQENASTQQEGDEIVELEEDIDAKKKNGPKSTPAANKKDDVERQQNNPTKAKVSQQKIDREVAKTLSDYMLYLLIMQPKNMTAVAGNGWFRFKTTCVDTKKRWGRRKKKKACSNFVELGYDSVRAGAKADTDVSLLLEGCRLAATLIDELRDDKWMVIHKVWVEMLCYAATHCSGNAHAAQLSKGGQLITFVWMLMVHLGLGKQFQTLKDETVIIPRNFPIRRRPDYSV